MAYFVFGGSGFVGTHLVSLIKELDVEAIIYNLDIVECNHAGRSVFVQCDVRNLIDVNLPCAHNDIIFNFAAIHRTPGHADHEYFETNILGAENVCKFAVNKGIQSIVFTSSISPYGAAEELKNELTLPMPNTPYGISKLVAEKLHMIWQASDSKRRLLILRPAVVFGKGENGNFTRLYWAIRNRSFFYAGRKDTIKGCIYVKELVGFMLFMLENMRGGQELFNCTYEPAYSIEQIVESMKKVAGLKRINIKINGTFLLFVAAILGVLGGGRFGIHPERVKKIMVSTNISGKKLAASGYPFRYSFEEALADWYGDNDRQFMR